MMSTQHTTLPKRKLADLLIALKENSEDGCFEAIRIIGKWATSEKVNEIVLPLDESLHEIFQKRLRQSQRAGLLPDPLTITIVAASQAT